MTKQKRAALGTMAAIALAASGLAIAQTSSEYSTRVVAAGLERPTGIVVQGSGTVFFTEVPTPGVAGGAGGRNGVRVLSLENGSILPINDGEPEPVNLALGPDGSLYWTCKSAGVILEREPNGSIGPFLRGLTQPNGVAVNKAGEVFFTQLPTPAVGGSGGGTNTVNVSDGTNVTVLTRGEPEPTDIAVAPNGDTYWTCKSAGVILERSAGGVVSVLLKGLDAPTGIALDHKGKTLYFTEVPTPGLAGMSGGRNAVHELELETMRRTLVDFGDPEPTDIAVAKNGNLYWTCSSAGVIVEAARLGGR